MGYLDGLINVSFKEIDSNVSVFFPYGKFGSGYIFLKFDVIQTKRFLRKYYIIAFFSTIITVIFFGFYALLLIPILLPWYFVKIHKILKNKQKSLEKYRVRDSIRTMSISMGLPTCLLLFLGGILLFAGSIFVLIRSNNKLLGFISFLFFGFGSVVSFKLLFTSIKYKMIPKHLKQQ